MEKAWWSISSHHGGSGSRKWVRKWPRVCLLRLYPTQWSTSLKASLLKVSKTSPNSATHLRMKYSKLWAYEGNFIVKSYYQWWGCRRKPPLPYHIMVMLLSVSLWNYKTSQIFSGDFFSYFISIYWTTCHFPTYPFKSHSWVRAGSWTRVKWLNIMGILLESLIVNKPWLIICVIMAKFLEHFPYVRLHSKFLVSIISLIFFLLY